MQYTDTDELTTSVTPCLGARPASDGAHAPRGPFIPHLRVNEGLRRLGGERNMKAKGELQNPKNCR